MSFGTRYATPRLVGFVVMGIGMFVSIFLGQMLAGGNLLIPGMIVGGLLAMTLLLALGNNYWYVLPAGFALATLPAIPLGPRQFDMFEVSLFAVGGMYIARMCLKNEVPKLARAENIPVLLFCAWVAVVYLSNPVGLLVLGATQGGVRFYFQIAFAAIAFFILSSKTIGERESKILTWVYILGTIVATAYLTLAAIRGGGSSAAEEFYSWHQVLSLVGFYIGPFLFVKYSLRDIFLLQRPLATIIWALLLLISLYSGKRAVLGVFLLYPFMSIILRRSNSAPAVIYGIFLAFGLSIAIIGNRQLFDLPLGMQRALSTLPGDWDPRADTRGEGTADEFREKMRELAWERAQQNPILGRGIGIDVSELAGMDITADYNIVALLAAGGAWHSTWYGLMADLGFPSVFLWAIYVIASLYIAYWVYRMVPEGSYRQLLAGAFFLILLGNLARSNTSGNAYLGAVDQWWIYGILVGLKYTFQDEVRSSKSSVQSVDKQTNPATDSVLVKP
jgi:hypothetical protein